MADIIRCPHDPDEATEEEAHQITDAIKRLARKGEWITIRKGKKLREAKKKKVWLAFDLAGWSEYCVEALGLSGDSEGDYLIRIAEFYEQFPTLRNMVLEVGKSKMETLLPHLGQNFETREFELPIERLANALELAHTLSNDALVHRLNKTTKQESTHYGGKEPVKQQMMIDVGGERVPYIFTVNPNTSVILDAKPVENPDKCIEVVTCKHCGAQNYAHIGYNHVVQVYAEPPEGEE